MVLAQVCAALGAPAGLVVLDRGGLLDVVAAQGLSGTVLVRFPCRAEEAGPLRAAVVAGGPVWLDDTGPAAGEWGPELPSTLAVVPLAAGERVVGALAVGFYEQRSPRPEEQAFLSAAASMVGPRLAALQQGAGRGADDTVVGAVADELPALLRAVSAGLSGDSVSFNRIDLGARTVTPLLQYEGNEEVASHLAPLLGVAAPLAGTVHERVVAADGPVFVPRDLGADRSLDQLPSAWRDYARQFPLHGLIAVPVRVDGRIVASLLAGRRRPDRPYTPADLEYVLASAHRLEGLVLQARVATPPPPAELRPPTDADHPVLRPTRVPEGEPVVPRPAATPAGERSTGPHGRPGRPGPERLTGRFDRSAGWLASLAWGVAAPVATAAVLRAADDPLFIGPTVLLAVLVALTVLVGLRAGLVAALVSVVVASWLLADPSPGVEHSAWWAVAGISAFAASCTGVLVAVGRLHMAREEAQRSRLVTGALLEQAPVGIALYDLDLRFVQVNQAQCRMDRRSSEEHLGRRPEEVSRLAGRVYQPLLESVRDTGVPIYDRALSLVVPDSGVERHYRASYYPIRDLDGAVVGVGATVEETTGTVVAQRRSEQLLELSTALAGVSDLDGFAEALNDFLAGAFTGRGAVVLRPRDGGDLELYALAGYDPEHRRRWERKVLPDGFRAPLSDAITTASTVEVGDVAEFDALYPDTAALRAESGDEAWLAVPLFDPFEPGRPVGAFQVSWTYPQRLSAPSRTLVRTIASMAELALSRIRIAQTAREDRFRGALDAMLDVVTIGRAVRDGDGRIVDVVLEYVNTAGDARAAWSRLVHEAPTVGSALPWWLDTAHFRRFVDVIETGRPVVVERERLEERLPDGHVQVGWWNTQIAPFGDDGYIATMRDVTDVVRAEAAARDAAELEQRQRVAVELLQRAALPTRLPSTDHVAVGALYLPAASQQSVGGDWYDAFPIDDRRLAVVIADVAGHGAEAAAFMVQVRNIVRAVALEHVDPDEVLRRVNAVVLRLQPAGLFVTCCYGVLEVGTGRFRWSLAGHPPPLVVTDGVAAYPTSGGGPPLALFHDATYGRSEVALTPGDRVYLYTDGLVERRHEPLDAGLERLRASVGTVGDLGVQAAVEALGAQVTEQFDDLALLCVELR